MDVKREGVARKKRIRAAIVITLVVAAVGGISWQLSKLKPAAPRGAGHGLDRFRQARAHRN